MGHYFLMAPLWKKVRFYDPIRKKVHNWPVEIKKELGAVLTRLQKGEFVGMPDVRPMTSVGLGVSEIRVGDRSGIYRTFHVIHTEHDILVFHAFIKKTQKTPDHAIKAGKLRLREFLKDLESKDE